MSGYQTKKGFFSYWPLSDLQSGRGFVSGVSSPSDITGTISVIMPSAWDVEMIASTSMTGNIVADMPGAWEVSADAIIDGVVGSADFKFPALNSPVVPGGIAATWIVDAVAEPGHTESGINGIAWFDMPGAWQVEVSGYLDLYADIDVEMSGWEPVVGVSGVINITQRVAWKVEAVGEISSYKAISSELARAPSTLVTTDVDKCTRICGESPCNYVGAPCYNTWSTCKYKNAYNPADERATYCLNETPVSVGGITLPYVESIKTHPLKIITSSSVIVNSKTVIRLYDEPDGDQLTDSYRVSESTRSAPSGSESITASGTYWRKWVKRNKYYKGRRLAVRNGFDVGEESSIDSYIVDFNGSIDDIRFEKNGLVTIIANGLLGLASDAKVPRKTDGTLWADATDSDTKIRLSPWSGIDRLGGDDKSKYTTGLIKINNEIISYTSSDVDISTGVTTLSGLLRGLYNQYGWVMPANHNADSAVHEVVFFGGNPLDIIIKMLKLLGIQDAEINLAQFEYVKLRHLSSVYFAAIIDSPEKIKTLLREIREQAGLIIWQDESQRITVKTLTPNPPCIDYKVISDLENIIDGSFDRKIGADKRVTRASIEYDHKVGSKLESGNFYRSTEHRSSENEHAYGYGRAETSPTIYSRWIWSIHGASGYTRGLLSSKVELLVDGEEEVFFDLEIKDYDLYLGEVFELNVAELVNENGDEIAGRYMVTSRERISAGAYRYSASKAPLDGRWLFICPDEFPDNWLDMSVEQRRYGCISNNDETAPDGEIGYKIAGGV